MKKIISVLLSVIMVFSLVSVAASAAEAELIITVANDLHYNHAAATNPTPVTEDYAHVPSAGQLRYENEIIIDTFLREAAANESSVLLLLGDLVDTGVQEEYDVMAAKLAEFERASGKSVYVVPGNHEFYNGPGLEGFITAFYEFGYSEAIARDTNSGSYVVDLNDTYRLLAIDTTIPGEGAHGINEERAAWIEEQAKKAQEDGKKTIAMTHHNLLEHMILGNVLLTSSVVDDTYGVQEIFTTYNVKYNFTGHTHAHDIASYLGENGNTFYSVLTGSINAAPCPYRVVTFGDEVKIETRNITSIDMSSLEGVISENCYNLATTDFPKYADECFHVGFEKILDSYLSAAVLKRLLGLNETDAPEMCALIDKLVPTIREAVYMPIYAVDETEPGNSLEAVATKLNIDIPRSEYKSFAQLALFLYSAHVKGDEDYGMLSTEYVLLMGVVAAFMNYVLAEVTAQDYTDALTFLCAKLGISVPPNFYRYAGTALERAEGIDEIIASGLNTILLRFTTDEAPKDNDTTLPGFDEEPKKEFEELTFWEKITNFFKRIFESILRLFSVGDW